MKHPLIAPSLLSGDFGNLEQELAQLGTADILHLDIMDGHYVPNLTFGYPVIKRVKELTTLPLDAHLMVTNPASHIDELARIGVNWISFHQECDLHSHRLVQRIKSLGIKAGIALNPAVPVSTLECLLPDLDYVLLMSVNPGWSGQSFIPAVLDKIRQLKRMTLEMNQSVLIQVDGGITAANAAGVISAGADILVSASYIFGSNDYSAAISSLRTPSIHSK